MAVQDDYFLEQMGYAPADAPPVDPLAMPHAMAPAPVPAAAPEEQPVDAGEAIASEPTTEEAFSSVAARDAAAEEAMSQTAPPPEPVMDFPPDDLSAPPPPDEGVMTFAPDDLTQPPDTTTDELAAGMSLPGGQDPLAEPPPEEPPADYLIDTNISRTEEDTAAELAGLKERAAVAGEKARDKHVRGILAANDERIREMRGAHDVAMREMEARNARAKELVETPVNRESQWDGMGWGQKLAAFFMAGAGGALAHKTGGRNLGLEQLYRHLDTEVGNQKDAIERQVKQLAAENQTTLTQLDLDNLVNKELQAREMAMLDMADDVAKRAQVMYDPRGAEFLARETARQGILKEKAKRARQYFESDRAHDLAIRQEKGRNRRAFAANKAAKERQDAEHKLRRELATLKNQATLNARAGTRGLSPENFRASIVPGRRMADGSVYVASKPELAEALQKADSANDVLVPEIDELLQSVQEEGYANPASAERLWRESKLGQMALSWKEGNNTGAWDVGVQKLWESVAMDPSGNFVADPTRALMSFRQGLIDRANATARNYTPDGAAINPVTKEAYGAPQSRTFGKPWTMDEIKKDPQAFSSIERRAKKAIERGDPHAALAEMRAVTLYARSGGKQAENAAAGTVDMAALSRVAAKGGTSQAKAAQTLLERHQKRSAEILRFGGLTHADDMRGDIAKRY